MSTEAEKKTFKGSCHCGHIRYEVTLALPAEPTAARCNCTICTKTGFTILHMPSASDFKLLQPSSWAECGDYQPHSKDMHKRFCRDCGVHVCGEGVWKGQGKEMEFFILNVATIDQPQEGVDLSKFKMRYGSNLDSMGPPSDKPYPHGLI